MSAFGQVLKSDTTYPSIRFTLAFSGGGGNWYPLADRRISLPAYIRQERRMHDPYHSKVDEQTDEPFNHTALWARFGVNARLFRHNSVQLDLLGEHRGESFGVFSIKNLVLLPLISFRINDSLRIFQRKWAIHGQIGYLEKTSVDQGLMFYNIDAQGTTLSVRQNNFSIQVDVLGDLIAGIGLGIDDAISLAFKRHNLFPGHGMHNLSLSVLKLTRVPQLATFENHLIPSLNYEFEHPDWQVNAQISMRFDDPTLPVAGLSPPTALDRLALKLGLAYSFQNKKLSCHIQGALRYYGRFFNADNYIPRRIYRDFNMPPQW